MNSSTQRNRTKRGEVYQLSDNKFVFVCVHCLEEFKHFTEFTVHVQKHFHLEDKQSTTSFYRVKLENDTANKSTEGQSMPPINIKVIDESDDDPEFTSHIEPDYKSESSSNVDSCRKRKRKRKWSVKERKFECFVCHKKLASSFVVKRHMKIHLFDDLKCKHCNTQFRTSRYYERHTCNRTTFVSQMPIIEEPVEIARIYECAVCKRIFRDRRQLQNHITKHKQSPCLCLICGKLFSGDRTLSRHMKLHNSSEESHQCTECRRKFKQRRYLLDHNRKAHNLYADDGQAICEICDQQFQNKRLLYIHKQTHPFVVEKRKFPCTMCNHYAKCAYDLRRHVETHSIENRSFECPTCHKKLLPRYANDHMKSHDLSRSFECKECGKQFKRANSLKRHQHTHKTDGNGSTFKCDVCPKLFARMDGLLRHRRRHGVAMNYHCRICNKGFIEQKSFLFHEANHTKGHVKNKQIQSK